MIDQTQINKIKDLVKEFFEKMTVEVSSLEANISVEGEDIVDLNIELTDPQILIGQGGQTLFETQRLLRMLLNKKLQEVFFINLDINGYKKQKIEYLKGVAKNMADQVSLLREEKELPPMSSYERRVIHAELAKREDVITESRGEGIERHIIIKPK